MPASAREKLGPSGLVPLSPTVITHKQCEFIKFLSTTRTGNGDGADRRLKDAETGPWFSKETEPDGAKKPRWYKW